MTTMTAQKQMTLEMIQKPAPDCPACQAKRMHNPEEWEQYHPPETDGVDNREAPGS